MSICKDCGIEISGLGYCDVCGESLCFLCHIAVDQKNGTACLCKKCHEEKKKPDTPRWRNRQC